MDIKTLFELVFLNLQFIIGENEWVSESVSESISQSVSQWMREWVSEWVSEWVLFQFYHDGNKLQFDEIIIMSDLYKTNKLSWNFMVLFSTMKHQSTDRYINQLEHKILN
jgi:hypothetical protein